MEKNMIFDIRAGKATNQIMLEGDIIIPDSKTDIGYIIWKDTAIHIDSTDIVKERVNYRGSLDMNILYMDKSGLCQAVKTAVPVNDFINIENIDNSMLVTMRNEIADVRYTVINERKINYRIVSDIFADIIKKEEDIVVTDIEDVPQGQKIIGAMERDRIVNSVKDNFTIKDVLAIPNGKPNIMQIIFSDAKIISKEISADIGRIAVRGSLRTACLYKSFDENMPEYIENEIPFNGGIECSETVSGMNVEGSLAIRNISINPVEDDNGELREIEIECTVGCDIKTSEHITENILEDAYKINKKTVIGKKQVGYSDMICRNQNSCIIKQRIKLDEGNPDILQVIKSGGNIHIDDFTLPDNKINAEGIINIQIMYTANDDEKPIYCIDAVVPFLQGIEAVGVSADKSLDIVMDSDVENVSINILSNREIEINCAVNINVLVFEEKSHSIITEIAFEDMDSNELNSISAMTVYVVKKGDTLWNIAKKYNTSVDEIVKVNDIENPNLIYPKQKLLILKGFCA